MAVHDELLNFKQAQPHKMNVGYRNVNCGIFYPGLVEVIAIFKCFIRCIRKGVGGQTCNSMHLPLCLGMVFS